MVTVPDAVVATLRPRLPSEFTNQISPCRSAIQFQRCPAIVADQPVQITQSQMRKRSHCVSHDPQHTIAIKDARPSVVVTSPRTFSRTCRSVGVVQRMSALEFPDIIPQILKRNSICSWLTTINSYHYVNSLNASARCLHIKVIYSAFFNQRLQRNPAIHFRTYKVDPSLASSGVIFVRFNNQIFHRLATRPRYCFCIKVSPPSTTIGTIRVTGDIIRCRQGISQQSHLHYVDQLLRSSSLPLGSNNQSAQYASEVGHIDNSNIGHL